MSGVVTFLARFRRAPRVDPRQGEIDDLHARLARCEEARAAAEEARAVAAEGSAYWQGRFFRACKVVMERDRTIAELEAELAPYKGHVG